MRDKYLYNSKDKESDYTSDDELREKEENYFGKEKQRQEGTSWDLAEPSSGWLSR